MIKNIKEHDSSNSVILIFISLDIKERQLNSIYIDTVFKVDNIIKWSDRDS